MSSSELDRPFTTRSSPTLSRRRFLRACALATGGTALLAACAPQASAPAPKAESAATAAPAQQAPAQKPAAEAKPAEAKPAEAKPAASADAPKKGGTMRVGFYVEAATMDPHLSGSKIDRQVYHNVFDPLLVIDNKLQVKPNLAESWQTPDPSTLVFKLRQGVKFHDGTDFNAEAAKFNFERMANEPKSVRKGEVANIGSVEAVDPYTLKLNLKKPDASLLATLTDRAGMMISPKAVQERGADLERNSAGAGTGPFEFVEWVKDDHITLKRNENYWNKEGGPYLDQIRFRPIPDDTVKLQSLQAGEIDVMDYVAPRDVAPLKADRNLVEIDVPSLACFWYQLNMTKPPFDNKALRQAVMYGIDTEAITRGVWLGVGVAANGPISPSSWAYDDTIKPIKRDVAMAKQKLAEGGMPGGFSFTVNTNNIPINVQEAEVMKAQLAEAGITMNVNLTDSARLLAEGNSKTAQMSSYQWSGRPDPDGNVYQFFRTTPGTSLNWSGISNPRLDELLDRTREVSDQAERKRLYGEVIKILHEEVPGIFVVHPIEPKAFSPKVQGYDPVPDGMMRFKDVWLR
jgi:peptide/nickel transport system substrate-binding protein